MNRRDALKKARSATESFRKREDNIISARRSKREEHLNSKRQIVAPVGHDPSFAHESNRSSSAANSSAANQANVAKLPHYAKQLSSQVTTERTEGAKAIRVLLSADKHPPVREVLRTPGVLAKLIGLLKGDEHEAQFEASWALTNILSGSTEDTVAAINAGITKPLVALLYSPHEDVREQAVWAIGNISGEGEDFRDLVIESGGLRGMLSLLEASPDSFTSTFVKTSMWVLHNLCRGKTKPANDIVISMLAVIKRWIVQCHDLAALIDVCQALYQITTNCDDEIMEEVMRDGKPTIRRLIEFLSMHDDESLPYSALRAIGNVCSGSHTHTQVVLDCKVLPALVELLGPSRPYPDKLRKEACWTLSNVTAGLPSQVMAVMDSGVLPGLVAQLKNSSNDVKREALWAVVNTTVSRNKQIAKRLQEAGVVGAICRLLSSIDKQILELALLGLNNLLHCGQVVYDGSEPISDQNEFAVEIEEQGGLDRIEELQNHSGTDVQNLAVDLLCNFFEVEALPQSENIMPAHDAQGHYEFHKGAQPKPSAAAFDFGDV